MMFSALLLFFNDLNLFIEKHHSLLIIHSWPELEDQPEDETIFRHDQLKMRLSEIDGVVEAIKLISDGQQIQTDAKKGFEGFDQGMWKGKIDAERYVLAGHSFGGTAVVSRIQPSKGGFLCSFALTCLPLLARIR